MTFKRILWVFSALILSLGTSTFAQQPETPSRPDAPGIGQHRRMRRMAGMRRQMLRRVGERLNLSEAQREQLRGIHQRQFEALKPQREELFNLRQKRRAGTFTDEDAARAKLLRQQMHEAMKNTHTEVQGVLTAEQKAQIDEFRTARKTRREEMRRRLREFRQRQPQ
jgi:Spy/CpxP family protein refolding chaperone